MKQGDFSTFILTYMSGFNKIVNVVNPLCVLLLGTDLLQGVCLGDSPHVGAMHFATFSFTVSQRYFYYMLTNVRNLDI